MDMVTMVYMWLAIGCVITLGVIALGAIYGMVTITKREVHLTARVNSLFSELQAYKTEANTRNSYCIACGGIMPRGQRSIYKPIGQYPNMTGLESAHLQCETQAKMIWKARGL